MNWATTVSCCVLRDLRNDAAREVHLDPSPPAANRTTTGALGAFKLLYPALNPKP